MSRERRYQPGIHRGDRRTGPEIGGSDEGIRQDFRGETDILVSRGTVTAENAAGTTRIGSGSMLVLGSDGYAELSPLPPPDDWQQWNERRDGAGGKEGPPLTCFLTSAQGPR